MKNYWKLGVATLALASIAVAFQNCAPAENGFSVLGSDDGQISKSSVEDGLYAHLYSEIRAPFKLERTESSPTGYRVFTTNNDEGSVLYEIDLPSSGSYQVEALVLADSSSRNSFRISVNGESAAVWNLSVASSYKWQTFGKIYNEAAGKQKISIEGGKAYTRLASLRLKSLGDNGGGSPSPTPSPTVSPSPSPTVSPSPSPTVSPSPSPTVSPSPSPTVTPGNPSKAPGENFDLSLWKITLPIDKSGGFTGTAMEVKPLPKTYQHPQYFYTASDGAMVFVAPTTGATTSGSKYPRSELREMGSNGQEYQWTTDLGGILSGTLSVNEVPTITGGAKGRVVIGQIHGPNDELVRLYYDNGSVYYYNDKAGSSGTSETKYELKSASGQTSNIPLNAKFSYRIHTKGTKQVISAVYNGVVFSYEENISSFWRGQALYFKAGVYVQVGKPGSAAGTTGTGQGKVSFYSLSMTHASVGAPAPLSAGGSSPVVTPSPSPSPSPTVIPSPSPTVSPSPSPTVPPVNSAKAPGENFDLSLWKITLPVDKSGGFTGTAMEVKPLPKTYQHPQYFFTAADGAMVFVAPTTGATTSGSKYPRTELREMGSNGKEYQWTTDLGGMLTATLSVNEVPTITGGAKGRVVIGQIHGPNDELVRLYYDNGAVYYYNDKAGSNGTSETKYVLKSASGQTTNIPMNAKFSYRIHTKGTKQVISAVYNGVVYSFEENISSFWKGQALYFKAGVYVQVGKPGSAAGTTGTGQGKVSFYSLDMTHASVGTPAAM